MLQKVLLSQHFSLMLELLLELLLLLLLLLLLYVFYYVLIRGREAPPYNYVINTSSRSSSRSSSNSSSSSSSSSICVNFIFIYYVFHLLSIQYGDFSCFSIYFIYFDSIECPQGGTTAAPPPLEDLGPTVRGHRSLAIEGRRSIAWQNLDKSRQVLGKISAHKAKIIRKS